MVPPQNNKESEMTIINCTPHQIVMFNPAAVDFNPKTKSYYLNKEIDDLVVDDQTVFEIFQPSGIVPRCTQKETDKGFVNSQTNHKYHIFKMEYGQVDNLPKEKEETYYIVSALVAQAVKNRHDLLVPTHMVRNKEGQILGCLNFSQI